MPPIHLAPSQTKSTLELFGLMELILPAAYQVIAALLTSLLMSQVELNNKDFYNLCTLRWGDLQCVSKYALLFMLELIF